MLSKLLSVSFLTAFCSAAVRLEIPLLSKLPLIGDAFFNRDILTYILYVLLILTWFFIKRQIRDCPSSLSENSLRLRPLRGFRFIGISGS